MQRGHIGHTSPGSSRSGVLKLRGPRAFVWRVLFERTEEISLGKLARCEYCPDSQARTLRPLCMAYLRQIPRMSACLWVWVLSDREGYALWGGQGGREGGNAEGGRRSRARGHPGRLTPPCHWPRAGKCLLGPLFAWSQCWASAVSSTGLGSTGTSGEKRNKCARATG